MKAIKIFSEGSKRIEIVILSRTYPHSKDYEDRKWLDSTISVVISGFTAMLAVKLRIEELIAFYKGVLTMIDNTSLEGVFSNLEENVCVRCALSKSGNVLWSGYIKDFEENALQFSFLSDFMTLMHLKDQLKEVIDEYPITDSC